MGKSSRLIAVDQEELMKVILWLARVSATDTDGWSFEAGVAAALGWLLQETESPRAVAEQRKG